MNAATIATNPGLKYCVISNVENLDNFPIVCPLKEARVMGGQLFEINGIRNFEFMISGETNLEENGVNEAKIGSLNTRVFY